MNKSTQSQRHTCDLSWTDPQRVISSAAQCQLENQMMEKTSGILANNVTGFYKNT